MDGWIVVFFFFLLNSTDGGAGDSVDQNSVSIGRSCQQFSGWCISSINRRTGKKLISGERCPSFTPCQVAKSTPEKWKQPSDRPVAVRDRSPLTHQRRTGWLTITTNVPRGDWMAWWISTINGDSFKTDSH